MTTTRVPRAEYDGVGLDNGASVSQQRFGEFREGWKPLLAAFLTMTALVLPYGTIGSFLKPLSAEFGWNFGTIQLALAFYGPVVALVTLVIGRLCDRIGARWIVIAASLGLGVSFGGVGFVQSLPGFYFLYALQGLMAAGLSAVALTHLLNQWFVHRRGLALGILMSASGVSNLVMPPLAVTLISAVGWRNAYIWMGLIPLILCVPILIAFFRVPARPRQLTADHGTSDARLSVRSTYHALARNRAFWVISICAAAVGLAYKGASTNLQVILTMRNFDATLAASLAGLIGASIFIGRLVTGALLDRIWAPLLALPLMSLTATACVLLGFGVDSVPLVVLAVILLGCALGAEGDLMPFMISRYINRSSYGVAFATVYAVYQLSVSLSPSIYGYVFTYTGSYAPALFGSAILFLAAGALMMTLGPYPSPGSFAPLPTQNEGSA